MFSPHHIIKGTALALALGAIAAPIASANTVTYSRQDKQLITNVGVRASQPRPPVIPNTPYSNRALGVSRNDGYYGTAVSSTAHLLPLATTTNDSFDWGDAGIGAAGGLTISMLAVGGALALSQRRSRRTGAPAVVAS
jgi:hypothetical protein